MRCRIVDKETTLDFRMKIPAILDAHGAIDPLAIELDGWVV